MTTLSPSLPLTAAPSLPATPTRLALGDILVPAFAITVAVWITAYLCRMPLVNLPGPVAVALMLAVILAGGFFTCRFSPRGIGAALAAGALSGLLDILIIGSLVEDYTKTHDQALLPSAALWFAGSILTSMVAAGIGGALAIPFPSPRRKTMSWAPLFCLVLAAATLPLITFGGLVTAFHVGLAVPDWPRSYGYNMFLFPLSMMQKNEGNFYEHAHRLMGALVGLTSLALALYLSIADRRWYIKLLPWLIGCGIGFQAYLGGIRVTDKSTTLAVIHGVFAQIVFAAMTMQIVLNMRGFRLLPSIKAPTASTDRAVSASLVAVLFVQLIFGSFLRHENAMLFIHITTAVAIFILAFTVGIRSWGLYPEQRPLVRAGLGIIACVLLQVVLGIIALVFRSGPDADPTTASALITTAHQANGALLLALATTHLTWTCRLLKPGTPEPE